MQSWKIILIILGIVVFIAIIFVVFKKRNNNQKLKDEKNSCQNNLQTKKFTDEKKNKYKPPKTPKTVRKTSFSDLRDKWDSLEPIRFVYIKPEYLHQLYTGQEIIDAKLETRPFVMYVNNKCSQYRCITAIPSYTVHNSRPLNRQETNIFYDNGQYYLNIEHLIYVPIKYLDYGIKFNQQHITSFNDIKMHTHEVNSKVRWFLTNHDTYRYDFTYINISTIKCIMN